MAFLFKYSSSHYSPYLPDADCLHIKEDNNIQNTKDCWLKYGLLVKHPLREIGIGKDSIG